MTVANAASLTATSGTGAMLLDALKHDAKANGAKASLGGVLKLLLLHSGFQALFFYRIELALGRLGMPGKAAGRVLRAVSVCVTSCHFSPRACLHPGISVPHGTGIVIGEGVEVQGKSRIYQHVTLGQDGRGEAAYPVIEEGATLYAGACVLGAIRIGRGAVVGANSVVLCSVEEGAVAVGAPARTVGRKAQGMERIRASGEPTA